MSSFLISRREFILSCVGSALAPAALAATNTDNNFNPLSFVFISDCHLAAGLSDNFMLLQESQLFLQDAIKQINLIGPDFVIFGGDQIHGLGDYDTNWQLFLDIVQTLDCPWYFVLGETDVSGDSPVNKMRTYARDWRGRGLNNDQPYWSCDPSAGIHLIGLDTSQFNSTIGHIDQVQLDWLRQDIDKNKNSFTILISHHPLLAPASLAKDQNNLLLLPDANSVRTILEESKQRILSISGHLHASKIEWHNSILYISNPSLDIFPCAFRHFKMTAQKLTVETHQVNYPALIKKAKINLLNSNLANSFSSSPRDSFLRFILGNRLDQNVSLSLEQPGLCEASKKSLLVH